MVKDDYTIETYAYGEDRFQCGDLYMPKRVTGQVICLFHGGFWQMPYDRSQMNGLCVRLVHDGHCVWNIEYRRTGYSGGGWTGTFDDAVAAVNHLSELAKTHPDLPLNRLIIAGHSAGGHLALWLAHGGELVTQQHLLLSPQGIIALAPVVDLRQSYDDMMAREAVCALLGQVSPLENPRRYVVTSPLAMLPASVPLWIVHGDCDSLVPVLGTREYVVEAQRLGDAVTYNEIKGGEHMDFLDPHHPAIDWVCRVLDSLTDN